MDQNRNTKDFECPVC